MAEYSITTTNTKKHAFAVEAVEDYVRVREKTVDDQGRISVGKDLAGEEITAIIHESEREEAAEGEQ